MTFSSKLSAIIIAAALAIHTTAIPAAVPDEVVSASEMLTWLSTTDAELTFVGSPPKYRSREADAKIMVTYCTSRTQNICGGTCKVYNGGAKCLDASGTSCLKASANVGFCDHGGCKGSCNDFKDCGTRLNDGFCDTPGTKSIIVPTND